MGERMYYIFKIIFESDQALTREQVVERLAEMGIVINVKTVTSTVECINEFFKGLVGKDIIKSIKKKGLVIENEIFEDGVMQFIIDSIMGHEDLNAKDKIDIKNKLLKFSSFHQQNRLSIHEDKDVGDKFSILINLSTIMKAIGNKKVIRFQYVKYGERNGKLKEMLSDKQQQYTISPYQIMIQNNHYYLIGYNDKYKDRLSMYRVDRMRNIQTCRQSIYEIREQYDMDDLLNKMMNMYVSEKRETIEFECNEKVLREVVSRFGINHSAKKVYGDKYLISIDDVSVSDGLVGWIMMLQDNVKIISPISLKETIQNKIDDMKKLYS